MPAAGPPLPELTPPVAAGDGMAGAVTSGVASRVVGVVFGVALGRRVAGGDADAAAGVGCAVGVTDGEDAEVEDGEDGAVVVDGGVGVAPAVAV